MKKLNCKRIIHVGNESIEIFRLKTLEEEGIANLGELPYSLKVLLENLLRHEDGKTVTQEDILAVAQWDPTKPSNTEIAFMPARVLLQDFTGVPCVVDLAGMRDAMAKAGGDPKKINPLQPVELVIDHSVQVDVFGTPEAFRINAELEFQRNKERYALLRWGQKVLQNFRVVPPDTGIVHQVNLEYLARGVMRSRNLAYPDTLVGTDSHTTMINGLGILGWGVGGIEAEAAMLGQPIPLLIPDVVGFRLTGALPPFVTATDLVLTITQLLRKKGVVGKFVEFFGDGLKSLSSADRATISNMAPEYGATAAIFPMDEETLRYFRLTGRAETQVRLIEAYAKEQGLFYTAESQEARYSDRLELNLSDVEPCIAGPRRPQDRVLLRESKKVFLKALEEYRKDAKPTPSAEAEKTAPAAVLTKEKVQDGFVVIAAITSCTNTSNPSVMLSAGLLAKKAVERGLKTKPWVKTSLAPGSQVVMAYLEKAGLIPYLEALGFHLVGFGCTTCIGNSGPLPVDVAEEIKRSNLTVVSVLSGNRNFEGRINPLVKANYLASPPLVVAYALAGRMDIDLYEEPLGYDSQGSSVFLKEIWPSLDEVSRLQESLITRDMFLEKYKDIFKGDERWNSLVVPEGDCFAWDPASTYIKSPPFFENFSMDPRPPKDILNARVLALLGDSVTTDHISPAGSILPDSPAGKYLISLGVQPKDFNSYGARRGNHEVMIRGTFANNRLKNFLVPGVEGGFTLHFPTMEKLSIYDAAMRYMKENVPLLVIAGKEYGSGSSRDWAAKGTALLGVRAVIAESFERIHRSNLIGMGVLPLEFLPGENFSVLGLTGHEEFTISGISKQLAPGKILLVQAKDGNGGEKTFHVKVRIDTPKELEYYHHGGILPFVLCQLLKGGKES
jgi:aconitate hydratase